MTKFIKTKIIATIGPSSSSDEKITELIKTGAKIFRINSSHGTAELHKESIEKIRRISKELNEFIAIILDLQGPKIRIGNLSEPVELKKDQEIILKPCLESDESGVLPVDYPEIIKDVKNDDHLLLDDGKIEFIITEMFPDKIKARVVRGGLLKSRKGLNIPNSGSKSVSTVTERDIGYIKFAVTNDIDYIALSFVRDKDDIIAAKNYLKQFNGNIPIIAKIEKPQAVENLESIIHVSDGVMVARGDLGIEISPELVPIVQKTIINEANIHRKPVITATQMLESMIEQPLPTRAEASDVANAIIDGTDAVMLSGETAVGQYPTEAVEMMAKIANNVETSNLGHFNQVPKINDDVYELDSQAIASAVIKMIPEVEIAAIVALTRTGYTAKLLSKSKPTIPIISISDDERVCRRLNLFWGVYPYKMTLHPNFTEEMLKEIDSILVKETFLNSGDKVIIAGGLPYITAGKTNFLRIHQLGSIGIM
ncbi:MAG: pyruvate kinase [Candidatus Melainabacteria bacterium GWA2_34_9]|nr:MAG: pyruvate kinase [Candidatus Melainabacteria bacterium GWA2_34_9]